jgi:CO dehydrogenase maturation factor
VQFHLPNATAWADDRAEADLIGQVDPDFVLGPEALAAAHEEGKSHVSAGS